MSLRVDLAKKYPMKDFEKKESKVKQSGRRRAVQDFCKDTTLHGFKYLTSENYYDRVGWLICCCASACCAGVLCSVLWARFLQVPALLTLQDLRGQLLEVRMPLVAVCPSAETVAYYCLHNLSIPENVTDRLPIALSHVLRRKKTPIEHFLILEEILVKNNLTLPQALMRVTPPCHSIVLNCRWQGHMMPCKLLFRKELTDWGACCVSRPYNLSSNEITAARLEVTRRLSISVQCSDQSAFNSCEFFTKFDGEEWIQPMPLTPGYNYLAHITFTSFEDSDSEKITEGTCVSTPGYSRNRCLLECKERHCGCSEPLRSASRGASGALPPCSITQLACLRTHHFEKNDSCVCLPACKKVFTYMALESSPMNAFEYTNDEIYAGLNASISSVLRIAVRLSESRLFVVNSTETWITLLSSLGGVFNMFLGVGLFSALEVLFLVFVRLPIAVRRSSDMKHSDM
ncbi:sodium channel protein Nach-like [Maniola jurtina]|uniref:sodium channel protein Nach-like n=1 Tax=Maniola jurtina TaxID=191418 RepID=UPI001E686081|nr:sodium channel protein Nach-like [Maniola jurtina]XP_045764045.1 sodium channel protein Nach-like [Maniola jurtina]XP_045764046.1 sodium channel protein Nach-like [Maniola jurtina]XP_045764047.1 sodium channel protein Nach-like [Maniola jurtina]XP_045764048.1 sodium channel protein Nach-like [Maniola jurtina]